MQKTKNYIFTLMGNISISFSKWVILILIVRLTNMEEVGKYTFAIAITTPIVLFVNMRLRLRYIVEDLNFSDVKKLRCYLSVAVLIFISLIGLIFYDELLIYMCLITLIKIAELQSDLYYAIYHKLANFKVISIQQIIRSIFTVLIFGLVLYISEDIVLALTIQVIFHITWLIIVERKAESLLNHNKSKQSIQNIWTIFIIGLPLAIVQVINSYNVLIPRYFIEHFVSVEILGVFAAISYLLTIVDLFMNAISQNIILDIKDSIKNYKYKEINRLIFLKAPAVSLMLLIFMPTITYITGRKIIEIIYGSDYSNYYLILVIVSISISFNLLSWIYDTTIMAFKKYKQQLYVSLLTLAVSVSVSFYFIYFWGVYGAAISITIISFTQMSLKLIILNLAIKKEVREFESSIYS
ncbi:lipopolysaccharide biosynthesis protein [Nosocomiicoccus sp. HMSC09A07]|uniref:lipopolysaccharide biosynthesis protein n=1 Tax=Nosocomiicoccus sp. HMSC09A07 TaxID=1581145 RepID=UPI0008A3C3FA|nr:polysaccharide biosynthesis C-terminal domain-containing protein [Nosocomiicoccus sp. HMSC09A07]OFS62176.1 hypothetical protein HMPREF3177_06675 [Nosocomiicoccus sp. HMSC09A07]